MNKDKSTDLHAVHRDQTLKQIWLPLILGIIIVLGLAVLVVLSSYSNNIESTRLASISSVLIIFPNLIIALILIALLCVLIFGVYKLTVIIPVYSLKAQQYVALASDYVDLWAKRAMLPILNIRSQLAAINKFFAYFSKSPK